MENSPRNQSEEDKAAAAKAELEDDDDEEESKHARRHAPGISVEKVKDDEKKAEKPRLSITDRLLESIGAKPEVDKDKTDVPEEVDSRKESEMDTVEATNLEIPAEDENVTIAGESPVSESSNKDLVSDATLETADWETEDTNQER